MSMKQSLNPTPFFNANKKQRKVHSTKRVYFHAELHQVKVVDEYNNVLAMAESVKMTVTRSKSRSRIGKLSVINAKGWDCVYYRYINDEQDLNKWIAAVKRYTSK